MDKANSVIRSKLRKLHALRTRLEELRKDESIATAECVAWLKTHKQTELVFAADCKALLETPEARVVDVEKFRGIAIEMNPERAAEVMDCIKRQVSIVDARKFLGDRLDEACEVSEGKPRLRIVGTRGKPVKPRKVAAAK